MIFGPTPLAGACGAVLAHTLRLPARDQARALVLRKGTVLNAAAVAAIAASGCAEVVAAKLEPGDVPEDEAAHCLAGALLRPGITRSVAATGRVNLFANAPGVLAVDAALVDSINALHESLTLATLPPFATVAAGEMLATVKVIPFAVPGAALREAEALARSGSPAALHPFRPLRAGLVVSVLPGMKESVLDNGATVTRTRLEAVGATLLPPERAAHGTGAIAAALGHLRASGAELLLVLGASAVVDRRDVAPAAIVAAGGEVEHFGMPVDPGNLLCLGRVGDVPALVLPGCARSPKLNGFDWVLRRLAAGIPVSGRDVMRMGAGGLLTEIPTRPLPRAKAAAAGRSASGLSPEEPGHAPAEAAPAPLFPARAGSCDPIIGKRLASPAAPSPRVAALVLAAGHSRRMGACNKLLIADGSGTPMVARVVNNAARSGARPVIVVTGHDHARVRAALAGRSVLVVHAPDHAEGLSTSLRAGLEAVPPEAEGVLVCLGDMPLVSGEAMARLVAAFDPARGHLAVIPTWRGERGNPVLWSRDVIPVMRALTGDQGARSLLDDHAGRVTEVAMEDDAVLRDFDTPESLAELAPAVV